MISSNHQQISNITAKLVHHPSPDPNLSDGKGEFGLDFCPGRPSAKRSFDLGALDVAPPWQGWCWWGGWKRPGYSAMVDVSSYVYMIAIMAIILYDFLKYQFLSTSMAAMVVQPLRFCGVLACNQTWYVCLAMVQLLGFTATESFGFYQGRGCGRVHVGFPSKKKNMWLFLNIGNPENRWYVINGS